MAKRILCVSLVQGSYQFLEIDKQAGGYFARPPSPAASAEALMTACRQASEIYFNADFPTASYEWATVPKVAKRHLGNLVQRTAEDKVGAPVPLEVQFKLVGEKVEAGTPKLRVSYIAIQEDDLTPLWETFGKFMHKVKFIAPLPVALASAVAQLEKPSEDFVVIWVGETSSVVAISSPEGLVKVARNVPLGLPRGEAPADPDLFQHFSTEFDTELSRTYTFFKQTFRAAVPGRMYLLGNNQLESLFGQYPLSGAPAELFFGLSTPPVQGLAEGQANESVNISGNLYLSDEFNFLPRETVAGRKTDVAFKAAVGVLAVAIAASAFWALRLNIAKQDRLDSYQVQMAELRTLQKEVGLLRGEVDRLRPFEGWKKFYEETFQARPAWNMVFSELAVLVPENLIINDLTLAGKGRGQRAGKGTETQVTGQIKADNWQQGLSLLREFGGRLEASPLFDVTNIEYTPEHLETKAKVFDFKISLTLLPQGSAL